MPDSTAIDAELESVAAAFRQLDPDGTRTAQVLRESIDQLYDGQRTGRYRWDQLHKTEKTHCGTLVEINLHREFNFDDGEKLDYRVAGIEVDCKYSQSKTGWMIPPEAHGQLCLLLWSEDTKEPKWSMGLIRVTADRLNIGSNRDGKATLSESGRNFIVWLFKNQDLPPNVLLQLDRRIVDKILRQKSGQKRINELFRNTIAMRVGRAVVATVAQESDYMKRVRGNGGARSALRPEGIIILGQYNAHRKIAHALGIPVSGYGESVAVRVSAATHPGIGVAEISGQLWKIAKVGDPIEPAPLVPDIKKKTPAADS